VPGSASDRLVGDSYRKGVAADRLSLIQYSGLVIILSLTSTIPVTVGS
jgi:hypothetical protein